MFKRDNSPEAFLRTPMPERYRLARALARRALDALDNPKGSPDSQRALALVGGIVSPLDDSSDKEALDDAIERAVDAIIADPGCVEALVTCGRALMLHGHFDNWTWHQKPLRDARKLLERAVQLAPADPKSLENLLLCELLLRRFEPALDMLNDLKERQPYIHAFGRGVWFDLHDNPKLSAEWFMQAKREAGNPERTSWALLHHAQALASVGQLELADARMADAVLAGRPHRLR